MRDNWIVVESKSFTLPSLPPSKNLMHSIIRLPGMPLQFRRSKQYERWRADSMQYIPLLTPLKDSHYFRVDATFEYDFEHKNGKMRRLMLITSLKPSVMP